MNKISTFFKSLFVAGMAMVGTQALAVDWIGSAPVNGGEYYLYNTAKGRWLWDTQYYDGSYKGEALSTDALLWTFSGSADATFTLTSANGKQFSQKNQGWANRIETMMTGLSGKRVNLRTGLENGKYSLYFNEREYSGGQRNVNSTSATRLETGRDAAYEWLFITPLEYQSAQPFYFKAAAVAGENGTAQVSFTEGTYTESEASTSVSGAPVVTGRTELQTKAYFHAVPVEGKVFVGWYDNAEMTGNALSASLDYSVDITSTSQTEEGAVVFTLYAKFGDKLQPVITADETDLLIDETSELLFENTTASLEYLVEKEEVISYDPATGVVTALKEGTSRLDFHQPAEGNIAEANISLEFTVWKHANKIVVMIGEKVVTNTNLSMGYDLEELVTITSDLGGEFAIEQTVGEEYAVLESGVLSSGVKNGWASWTVRQEATDYYYASQVTFTVNVVDQEETEDYVLEVDGSSKIDIYGSKEFTLPAAGQKLSFRISRDGTEAGSALVSVMKSGEWVQISDLPNKNTSYEFSLDEDVTAIRFHRGGAQFSAIYIHDVKVTRLPYIKTPDTLNVLMNTNVATFDVDWSCSDGGDIRLLCDNENFELSQLLIENTAHANGKTTITVTYFGTEVGEVANVVVYNHAHSTSIRMVTKYVDPTALDNASLREAKKVLRNGQVFIVRDGKLYDLRGMVIE